MIQPTSRCTGDTIVAEVFITAPRSVVWTALTDAKMLGTWWGAPELYRADDWTIDLRVGGGWIARGVGADGSTFSVSGEFVDIAPPERLAMTWKPSFDPVPPTTIVYELASEANGTRLRVTHSGFAEHTASRDNHARGWVRVLGWLGAFAEGEARAMAG